MANRRRFSTKICQSYSFLGMSAGAQALYLAILGMCDDDGIFEISFAKRIANRRKQDVEALLSNGYIAIIDDRLNLGYVVDWHSFNDLKADRCTPSVHRQTLINTFPNIENSLFKPKKNAFGIQKDSLDKNNEEDTEDIQNEFFFSGANAQKKTPPTKSDVEEYCRGKNYHIDVDSFMTYYNMNGWTLTGGRKMTDWTAAVDYWHSKGQKIEKEKGNGDLTATMPAYQEFDQGFSPGEESPFNNGLVNEMIRRKREKRLNDEK